ncbi:Z-DNA-binding protein 1 isoform X2 [Choloepus didactylus]|uniref:Z-DNA-binding protein 1 isoform X2 n=1 Tax=Choloepus didactylus TaxID=27675 RepID=UPI00189F24B4|nr:Z-DNA-binding protein 1 isoform X2 [Choloepus didactylus]
MAKAPADPATEGDLEQKILQVLRDAGSPLKTTQLVKECQVPKKELNQVLYQMQKKSKVTLAAPATWCFGGSETRVTGPAALAEPGGALTLQKGAAAVPPTPGPQLSGRQEAIYRLLEAGGPLSALNISQALGMKTAKDVNRDLYEMRDKHLLSLDQNSKSWTIYRPGDYERKHQLTTVIYQQNPVNVIHQNGPNSQISIIHSEATQIGHGNTIKREMASGESGSTAPLRLPPTAQGDASMQGSPAGAWGVQDIHVEKSVFRRVQLGHGNEMSLHGARAEGPVLIPSGSPPGGRERQRGREGTRILQIWESPPGGAGKVSLCRHRPGALVRSADAHAGTSPRGGRGPASPHCVMLPRGHRHRQQQQNDHRRRDGGARRSGQAPRRLGEARRVGKGHRGRPSSGL